MFQASAVAVADQDERRRDKLLDRPVVGSHVELLELFDQCGKRRRIGRRSVVRVAPRRSVKQFRTGVLDSAQDLGIQAIAAGAGGCDDQLANPIGMPKSEVQCNAAAEAVAVDVALLDSQRIEQCGHVIGELLVRKWAVDVGRVSVSLQLDGDHAAAARKGRHEIAHQVDCHERAGQHHERVTGAADLVVHGEPVDCRIARIVRRHRCSIR